MVDTFFDLYDATMFIETLAEDAIREDTPFKAELTKTEDNRWRVGIIWGTQGELFVK